MSCELRFLSRLDFSVTCVLCCTVWTCVSLTEQDMATEGERQKKERDIAWLCKGLFLKSSM